MLWRALARVGAAAAVIAWVLAVPDLEAARQSPDGGRPGAQGANLVVNGSFERASSGGAAEGWELARDATTVDAALSLDAGRQGGRCQKLTCSRLARETPSSHAMLAQVGRVRLEQGRWYRLSLWARESGMASPGVSVAIVDTREWQDCGLSTRFRLGREWRRCSQVFQATRSVGETSRLQIWYAETGTLWVDDVELVPSEPPRPHYAPGLPPAPGKNLVPNASFEAGPGGWGSTADMSVWGSEGLDFRIGEIDESTASEGTCSYKIALTPENTPVFSFDYYRLVRQPVRAPLLASEGWIPVAPGQPYTLSAAMRADRPGVVAVLGLRDGAERGPRRQVTLTPEWRRYSFTFRPTTDACFVTLGPDLDASRMDAATVWIDAVQLERGEAASGFAPYSPVEVGFEMGRLGNQFPLGTVVAVRADVANHGPREAAVRVRWQATDFFDRPAGEGTVTIRIPAGGHRRQTITTSLRRPGFYRLRLTAEAGGRTFNRELRTAVLAPVPPGDSHFGVNHAYGWPQLLELCDRAGLRWMRDWSIKWGAVQPKPGPFDFSGTDYQLGRVLDRKLPLLALLPFPSTDWAADAPAGVKPSGGGEDRRLAAFAPKDPAALAAYVNAAVRRYRDRVKHWEFLNEPIYTDYSLPRGDGYQVSDYVRLLAVASKAAKAADPTCTVIGGIAGPPELLTREFLEAGGLAHIDALNLHTYPGDAAPESYEKPLQTLRERMRAAGRGDLPIWLTEYAYYADDDPPIQPHSSWMTVLDSEREASEFMVKFAAVMLGYGVEKVFYHSGTCGTLNLDNLEGIFFEYGGAPRKMLAAQAALARMLPGSRHVLKVADLAPRARGYLFGDAAGKVMVLWARGEGEPVSVRLGDGRLTAVDIMGNVLPGRAAALTETPLYITGPARLSPEEFVSAVQVER